MKPFTDGKQYATAVRRIQTTVFLKRLQCFSLAFASNSE